MLIREILAVFRRWLWLIILCTLAGSVFAYWRAAQVEPTYEGDAGVVVVRQNTQVKLEPRFETSLTNDINIYDRDNSGLLTLASLVTNEAIAQAVFDGLNGELGDRVRSPEDLLRFISSSVSDGVIRVKARSDDPEFAARLANAWAKHYADYVNRIYAGQAANTDLSSQVTDAQQRYQVAQDALVAFTVEDPSAQLNSELADRQAMLDRLLQLRADGLAGDLERAYNRRQISESLLNDAQVLRRLLVDSESSAADSANTLALLALQFYAVDNGYSGASLGDGANNSAARGSGLQFNFNPQRLDDVAVTSDQLLGDLDNLLDTLQERLAQYNAQIEELSQEALTSAAAETDPSIHPLYAEISDLQGQLATLEGNRQQLSSERDRLWESFNLLSNAAQEVLLTTSTSDGTLIRYAIPASIPRRPIQAPPTQSLIIGAFLGLMLGIALAFLLELTDDKVRRREDVEEVLQLEVLSVIPKGRTQVGDSPVVFSDPHASVVEGVRFVRSAVDSASPPVRSLLITSVKPGEGKSTVAANLAVVSAAAGLSVILIDANLRSPRMHTLFGLPSDNGLANLLLANSVSMESNLQPTKTPGLRILVAGADNGAGPDLLARPVMQDILTEAAKLADLVLIDTSAAGTSTETIALAGKVDGIALVLRPGSSSVSEIQHLQHSIEAVSGRLLGVVMNRVKTGFQLRPAAKPGKAQNSVPRPPLVDEQLATDVN